jgi:spermidine/putrescine transport system substrate-binding protein
VLERPIGRRQFLTGTAGLVGLGTLGSLGAIELLSACGASSTATASPSPHPPIGSETGNLSILEWAGYEADGTPAAIQGKYGLTAGGTYTKQFGASGITYSYIQDDDQALQKATSSGPFDLIHPCHENIQDYVARGLVQPWDTSLLPSFSQLNPGLVKAGQLNGKQYMIPWDWGYGSLLYRTDKIDPADATGWELAWNSKYSGKIALWSGASTNFEIAALYLGGIKDIDNLGDSDLARAKAALLTQKPLNKLYWSSEYGQEQPLFQAGTTWITYAWQDSLVSMKAAGIPCAFMNPRQGRLSWFCGFMIGAKTQNWYHAHDYVESFINHDSCLNLTNTFYYGSSNTTVTPDQVQDQNLVKELNLADPLAITSGTNHLQSWSNNRPKLELDWQEVVAS